MCFWALGIVEGDFVGEGGGRSVEQVSLQRANFDWDCEAGRDRHLEGV